MGGYVRWFVRAFFCVFFAGLLLSHSASAQLAIDKLWIDFENSAATRGDLLIANESSDRYYINVDVFEIINPGTEQEERRTYVDPAELGLLVTPNRVILEPGQSRSLRVIRLDELQNRDRIYRIRVEPKVGELSFSGVEEERSMLIKLLAAYEVLVTSRPGGARNEIKAVRNGQTLELRNNGNSNVLLFDGHLCAKGKRPDDTGNHCTKIDTRRLYAQNVWTIELEDAGQQFVAKARSAVSRQAEEVVF